MAITPSRYLCDQKGFIFYDNVVIEGMTKTKVERKVVKSILFKNNKLMLLILGEPIWQLGWCGINYIHQKQRINEIPLNMILN